MSSGAYHACDMCGRIEMENNTNWSLFHSGMWTNESKLFDLCPECSAKVQKLIHGYKKDGESDGEA